MLIKSSNVIFYLISSMASGFLVRLKIFWTFQVLHQKYYHISLIHLHYFELLVLLSSVYTNHLFHLYQQARTSLPKAKFRQVSDRCKRIRESSRVAYAIILDQRCLSSPRNLVFATFDESLIVFSSN